jgi:hypothetical protein
VPLFRFDNLEQHMVCIIPDADGSTPISTTLLNNKIMVITSTDVGTKL